MLNPIEKQTLATVDDIQCVGYISSRTEIKLTNINGKIHYILSMM